MTNQINNQVENNDIPLSNLLRFSEMYHKVMLENIRRYKDNEIDKEYLFERIDNLTDRHCEILMSYNVQFRL